MFETFLAHTCIKTNNELNLTHKGYHLLTLALDFRISKCCQNLFANNFI